GKTDFVCETHAIAFAVAERCRCPLTDAVERQNGGFLKRGGEESARRMRFMMIGEHVPPSVLIPQSTLHFPLQVKFRFQPQRQGLHPGMKAVWSESNVGLDHSIQ